MVKKIYLGILILVLLTASIYVLIPNKVRIDVETTYSTFKVYEEGWVLAGTERTILWDGTKKMRASDRMVNYTVDGNTTKIYRYAYFKEGCIVVDTYSFDGNVKDIERFPINHKIETNNCVGFLLDYEIKNLEYTGETSWDLENPSVFGHNMKVEWEDKNYYSRIYKYKDKDVGKLNIKYRIDSPIYSVDVRLFDPPGDIGYEFLDDNKVVHIWNNIDDYFFDVNSGIQFTNYYEDYWSKNVFCIGYYSGGNWNKIKCADEIPGFNKNIQTDNLTYVNATLWKDFTYSGYDLRLGIRYHLGMDDKNLSITIYGKNIGVDIPFDLGFAWKVKDLDVPPETTDKILINGTVYELGGIYDLTFKNMTRIQNITSYDNETNTSSNEIVYNAIPFYKIYDYEGGLTGKENFLRIDWNENLNYAVKMYGNGNQEDFYVALLVDAGHFNPNQEKSTTFYWIDALTSNLISYWKMDESSGDMIDSHGSNDGTITGAVQNVAGKINTAYNFTDDKVVTGTGPEATGDWSASLWAQLDIINALNYPLSFNDGSFSNGIYFTSTNVNFYDGASSLTTTQAIEIGKWYFVVLTKTGATYTLYIGPEDGAITSNSGSFNDVDVTDVVLGNRGDASWPYYGLIDEVGFWDRELTSSEVSDLFNSGSGFEYPFSPSDLPEVTLNTPANTSNFSTSSVTFGGIVSDDINLINVSLIIDDVYNETNTSGINNSNYTFTKIFVDGDYTWNYEGCDNHSQCTNGTARTFTIDLTNPLISYNPTSDGEGLVSRDWILVNVTATDTHLDSVRMNFNGTNETFTTNVGADYWENKSGLSDGNHSFYGWANDTFGNYNFTTNYTVTIDTTDPLISYQGETGDNASSYNRSWIFVNVSVTESNEENITFNLYHQNNTLINSSTYTDYRRTINWTIGYGIYNYNVTVWDQVNKSNSTGTRMIYLSDLFLYIENEQANLSVEMGTLIELIANSTLDFGLIYFDVDHPSYGDNYNSSALEVLLNITIEWFRKTLFNNRYSTQNLTYDSVSNITNQTVLNASNFNVAVHQYDYVNNLSVNLTGNTNKGNSTTEKSQIIFYKANDSDSIDRIFYGDLIGEDIYQDRVFDNSNGTDLYLTSTNVSFENEGEQLVYFYLDDNADLVNFILNITGYEYGFNFSNSSFRDWEDGALSNASVINNFIFPKKTGTSGWTNYGQFDNTSIWDFTLNDYTFCEDDTGYCEEYSTSKESTSMWGFSELTDDITQSDESDSETITSNVNLFNYTDILNSLSFEEVTINFSLNLYGYEGDAHKTKWDDCDWDVEFLFGGTKILDLDELHLLSDDYMDNANCLEDTAQFCDFTFSATDLSITISRNGDGSDHLYNYKISGTENYEAEYDNGSVGSYFYHKYYDNSTWVIHSESAFGYYKSGTLSNSGNFTPTGSSQAIQIYNKIYGRSSSYGIGFVGCSKTNLNTSITNVSVKLNSYENSSYVSTSVFDSSVNINKVNVTVDGVYNGTTHISGDYGENWQTVSGVENNIDNPGKNILWWQKFTPDSGYLAIVPYVSKVNILSERGDPSNVSLDFGDDGTYDYTMSGYLNGTNETLIANLTLSDISGAFTGSSTTGQTWLVPLRVFSSTAGIVNLNTINLTYDPNPVYLNVTSIQRYIDDLTNFSVLNISVGAINGTVNLTDLRYDYLGGNDTIEIKAHNADYTINISRWITVYYSSFSRLLPYTWTDDIFFLPRTNSSKNVSAYMQTSARPILNITTTNYGGMESNLSIAVDRTYTCLNLTWSNSSTIPISGNKINTTWQDIAFNLGYLSNPQIWIWADLEECDPTDSRILVPYLNLSTSCEDCYWDGT